MSQDAPSHLSKPDREGAWRIAIVASRFNPDLIDGLMERTRSRLDELGIKESRVDCMRVPGSAELPYAAQRLADCGRYRVIIALGVLIRGETQHHDIISRTVSFGLQEVALSRRIPVINGVISAESWEQARDRTIGPIERGREFAEAAVEMANWNA